MSYLVDTNVYSEPVKPKPDMKVVTWLRDHESELYVSTIKSAAALSACQMGLARPGSAFGSNPSATA